MLNYINLIIYECHFDTYSSSKRIKTMYVYSIYQDYLIPIRVKMLHLLRTYLRKRKKLNLSNIVRNNEKYNPMNKILLKIFIF